MRRQRHAHVDVTGCYLGKKYLGTAKRRKVLLAQIPSLTTKLLLSTASYPVATGMALMREVTSVYFTSFHHFTFIW